MQILGCTIVFIVHPCRLSPVSQAMGDDQQALGPSKSPSVITGDDRSHNSNVRAVLAVHFYRSPYTDVHARIVMNSYLLSTFFWF